MNLDGFIDNLDQFEEVEIQRDNDSLFSRYVDFLIADYDDYSDGRVASSSVAVPLDNQTVLKEGRIHAPTVVQSYALEKRGTVEPIYRGITVNVIDHVLHIYIKENVPVEHAHDIVKAILSDGGGTALERVQNVF